MAQFESFVEALIFQLTLNEYQVIHTTCFRPYTTEETELTPVMSLLQRAATVDQYLAKLNSRSIESIKAGVHGGNVDDIFEYGVRYAPFIT
jgi:hypothetical protein